MSCKSTIYKKEAVANEGRKFGSAIEYFPCWIARMDGSEVPALFTQHQIVEAIERAAANPEDVPEKANWLQKVFNV